MNLNNYFNKSAIGCIGEVNLDYSDQLHDVDNDYHLAGEKIKVTEKMFSEYQVQIIEYSNSSLAQTTKLILNLGNKKIQTTLPKLTTLFKFVVTI